MNTSQEVLKNVDNKMKKTVESTQREFGTVRTGRAHSSLVEGVSVDYYGSSTPLKQMATISTPEPRLIVINPWDKSIMSGIEKAIFKANLGLTPNNDGKVIRISVPQLTSERREELKKVLKQISESGKISLRTARRSSNEVIDAMEKDKKITEDDKFGSKDKIQKMIEKYEKEIDTHLKEKEHEISVV